MANKYRGEIEATLDGRPHRLCLTLGALAELEQAFGDQDLLALAERFERGRLSARDAIRIIGAGLRGAGADIADADVEKLRIETGAAGYVDIVARLLLATFGGSGGSGEGDAGAAGDRRHTDREGQPTAEPRPFPGAR